MNHIIRCVCVKEGGSEKEKVSERECVWVSVGERGRRREEERKSVQSRRQASVSS